MLFFFSTDLKPRVLYMFSKHFPAELKPQLYSSKSKLSKRLEKLEY